MKHDSYFGVKTSKGLTRHRLITAELKDQIENLIFKQYLFHPLSMWNYYHLVVVVWIDPRKTQPEILI